MLQNNQQRNTIKVILVAIIIILCAAALTYVLYPKKTSNIAKKKEPQTQALPTESTFPEPKFPPIPHEEEKVFSYSGRITSFDINAQTVKLATNYGEKTIQLNPQTTIVKQENPDQQQNESGSQAIYKEGQANISQLQTGLFITAEANEDIKGIDQFQADKIIILPSI